MMRVAIIDDHAMVRTALRMMLDKSPEIDVVADVASLDTFFKRMDSLHCDVVILDLNLEETQGMVTLEHFLRQAPNLPVLVLSAYEAKTFAPTVIDAGAKGFLSKNASYDTLIDALQTVYNGAIYRPDRSLIDAETSIEVLSKREREILCFIAQGWQNKKIAEHLEISPKTVSTYRRRMMEKLCLGSNQELYRYAMMQGLGGG